jgi:tRNA-Thr(GGU) m(6)t(6)A37 methyltransferase TsaA
MKPIGIIHSLFHEISNMPIQPAGAKGIKGEIEIYPEFTDGLEDLDGFSHIYLLYKFHQVTNIRLKVVPFMDNVERGIFSTRSPARPNPIGISIVKLLEIKKNILTIEGVDILDGTPLLDIKPYIKKFDHIKNPTSGWMKSSQKKIQKKRSDKRFN